MKKTIMLIGVLTKIVYVTISVFVLLVSSTVIGICDECVKGGIVLTDKGRHCQEQGG